MREVNFSIPNVNKASVGITTALYDRRALDCTSTLPLINSLNHLAYLTTSSARIRDILTVDGGIERLVCILKQGRSRDMMDMWKWNLAFQCVVNIGVRGTEAVRTRVVEADMVPVIATILDNYIKVIEKCRERAEEAKQRQARDHQGHHRVKDLRIGSKSSSFANRASSGRFEIDQHRAFRRQAPPPSIDVSAALVGLSVPAPVDPTVPGPSSSTVLSADNGSTASSNASSASNADNDATPTMSQFHITSPPVPIPVPTALLSGQMALGSPSSHSSHTQMTDRAPIPILPRQNQQHSHHHHHHHHHATSAPGPSTSSLSTSLPSSSAAMDEAVLASATAASNAVNASTRHTISSPFQNGIQPLASVVSATAENGGEQAYARTIRDADRFAARLGLTVTSQPASPTTPLPPPQLRSPTVRPTSLLAPTGRSRRRPSIRHQSSTTSGEADDINAESVQSDETPDTDMSGTGNIQPAVDIQDIAMEESESILGATGIELTTPTVSETQETGTFNITHRAPIDGGSIINAPTTTTTPVPAIGLSPNRPAMAAAQQPIMPNASVPRYLVERQLTANPYIIAAMPREEDVLMSLQLLAYVSKYCNLRTYFQKSHLVPRLKIGKELQLLDGDDLSSIDSVGFAALMDEDDDQEEEEEEYLLPNDLNIFPLVEKFTVRYHSTDMQYWAGVVMRNLCRKDDTRGGIRQCAYYQCGKWEEFTRQFAKCRRCRRTKYCSKECQKSAWAFHRHWCVAASQ
ncbi:mynd domain containing protein [Grosmannia clavigera kw1407]|uniref:MYND-type zinc finger protein samB n=1 Tax=Grosmannia clavigera (strain kw1407 / UAMH 11150) TaxID=655863 RepID=F0XRG1_GROCL|nr:mynd domain containing protein [Grosmannia clavigera kw1407]EFW99693.1 mynd domain containing protein [Grosmannia clavigera kw1407]